VPLRVGLFTEVFHPIVNGVVASIDALRDGLRTDGVDVVTFAPRARAFADDIDDDVVRFPSLPLPTTTGYRLCIPYLHSRDRARMRSLDVVHAHSPFVSGWTAAAHARRARVPLIFTYHTQLEAYAHYAPFDARVTRATTIALTRAFANRADAVVAPTHAMRERLRELGVTSRIHVVRSAIDVARFANGVRSEAVRGLLGARDGDAVVVLVARAAREKNVELAIDAMAFVPSGVRLAIVGDGPHRAALEARARACGVSDRVRFAGALPPAAMPDVYAACDAFAFTSLTDTQGLVLAEAAAAGLPIVAADSAVARETAGAGADVVPAAPAAFGRALAVAARRPRAAAPDPAGASGTAAFARAMQDVYRAAQSAVHLAL
jgi:glycosyltransferase involved in cell wall biosynthesis